MKIAYIEKHIGGPRLRLIEQANSIIAQYAKAGFTLTLRQLFYQFVSRDLIPNTQKDYKRLGEIISDGRMAGLIDWNAISDRLRVLMARAHWDNPAHAIESAASRYGIDLWQGQKHRVEVWIEKDALSDIVDRVCGPLDVPYLVCRGFASQTALWEAAQRLAGHSDDDVTPVVLHLGDHDPSGVDMTRDNRDRVMQFGAHEVILQRIALNMDQVKKYKPPPNPAKKTDSRTREYVSEYGTKCWELDALNPEVLAQIITDAVLKFRDEKQWNKMLRRESADRRAMRKISSELGDR